MNDKLLYFALGGVTGALVTYFSLKKKYEKDFNNYRDELLDLYQDKSAEGKTDNLNEENDIQDTKQIVDTINSLVHSQKDSSEMVQYSEMYGNSDDKTYSTENDIEQLESMEDDDEDEIEEIEYSDFPTEDELPYIITEAEYADPVPANDKIALKYYVDGDILIDEVTHEILDVSSTISEANLNVLVNNNDEDIIYVRNNKKGTDYEVTMDENDYAEAEKGYLGIF